MRFDDDMTAFKDHRAVLEARAGWLIDAAFKDILAGRFDSDAVHEAMKLGTHPDYQRLKDERDAALRVARHAGAL